MQPQYGAIESTEIIDDNGSTMTTEQKIREGYTQKPVRKRYEIRHRTDKTDLATVASLAKALLDDFSKLDAELKLERTTRGEQDGYYNLVECYTILEY